MSPNRSPGGGRGGGDGTDVATEAADITLIKGDLSGVAAAVELSRATMRTIRQNLFFAFAYNVLGIPVAAGVLDPLTGWLLSPALASAAMALWSVSLVTNALRLGRFDLKRGGLTWTRHRSRSRPAGRSSSGSSCGSSPGRGGDRRAGREGRRAGGRGGRPGRVHPGPHRGAA